MVGLPLSLGGTFFTCFCKTGDSFCIFASVKRHKQIAMTLNKDEFKVMVMLYAANIDGNIQSEEVKVMLEKTDFETVEKVEKLFDKMSDLEVLECIRENKVQHAATEADRMDLIANICAVVEADEKCSMMEEQMVRAMRRVLE